MGRLLGTTLGTTLGTSLGTNLCAAPVTSSLTPGDIIAVAGDRLGWWRADLGITLNGARVSGWANQWGNGDLVQATGATQPLLEAAALGGLPAVTNDGATGMTCTLTSGVLVGERPYVWCMCRIDSLPGTSRFVAGIGNTGVTTAVHVGHSSADRWRYLVRGAAGANTSDSGFSVVPGAALLVELGLTTGSVGALVVSGTAANAPIGAGAAGAATQALVLFGANGAVVSPALGKVAELIVSRSEPTAQQKTDMRAYFASRYGAI